MWIFKTFIDFCVVNEKRNVLSQPGQAADWQSSDSKEFPEHPLEPSTACSLQERPLTLDPWPHEAVHSDQWPHASHSAAMVKCWNRWHGICLCQRRFQRTPGHSVADAHSLYSRASPRHRAIPSTAGFGQTRCLTLFPRPQVTAQRDHSFHACHSWGSTETFLLELFS